MARPQKHTVDYFPHYVTHGKTLLILNNEYGNDGYAFWFKLLELLCSSDGQFYNTTEPASWRLLLAKTCVTEDMANNILDVLAEVGAIDSTLWRDGRIVWVQNLVDNLELVYRRRSTAVPEKPVIVDRNPPTGPVSDSKNPQTKLNKTKLNKTKDDGGMDYVSPTMAVKDMIREVDLSIADEKQAFDNTRTKKLFLDNQCVKVPIEWWTAFEYEFSDLDITTELKKFADHWYGGKRKLKNVRLALRNWFVKAREIKARSNGADGMPSARKIKEGWG